MLNFAILGAGMVANYHRQAVRANEAIGARLAAVAHYNPARFAEISTNFGAPCLTYEAALARPDIDAVLICTPNGQHAAQAIAAARAGKHVLVEKPMALTLADADAMIDACQRAGVKLGVVFQRRTDPVFVRVHEAIAAGDLGEMRLAALNMPYLRTAAYFGQADWRGTWAVDGGGVLMNQGIHLVDQLVWNMGDAVAVQASAATLTHAIEVEDTLAATLRFANGSLATINATTTAAPGFAHSLGFYGSKGGILIEGEQVKYWSLVDPAAARVEPIGAPVEQAGAGMGSDPRGIKPTGHIALVRDFVQAIEQDRAPLIDGAEGRRGLAAVLAIYQAAGLIG